ncbi:MAG TPA: hypothetical protein DD671_05365 [Balneolaceae bacterium]|nr:hypothetical protein [Balneola sp.]HBQ59054.1 hypothetical protein [Balneolaceae bacterium]|tara:strand:+ start:105894 stop:106631 length:738 start_codon:yes stop_codon:yes gene_type:complete
MAEIMERTGSRLLAMTVSELLEQESRATDVLKNLGLPIKGNEDKSVMEVCTAQQKNEDEVLEALLKLGNGKGFEYPPGIFGWSPELVVKYLEEEHHSYTRSLVEDATGFEHRACDVHGTQYPELNQVRWYFEKLKEKLEFHLKFQEEKFFPAVLKLFAHNGEPRDGLVKSLKKQIALIQKDQEEIEYQIGRIAELTDNFTPPSEACTTFRLLYTTLKNLKDDLEKHHFLEEQYLISGIEPEITIN